MRSKRGVFRLNTTTTKQPSIFRGLVFAALSGVVYSTVAVIVKQMKNIHPGQLAFYRFIATLAMSMPEIAKTGQNPLGQKKFRFILVLRGIFGGLNMFLNFFAFRYLGLGEASVIILSSPVFVTIFARIFFKEPCNIFQSITVILTVIGIIFTTKLPSSLTEIPVVYSSERIYGLLAAILSVFSVTAIQMITRKMKSIHQAVITFNYSWLGILESILLTAIFGNFQWLQCGSQSLYILLLALLSYIALALVVMAFQCEYAGPVATVMAATDISMSFMWQISIFHDVPDSYGIIGAILVSVSIILIGLVRADEDVLDMETIRSLLPVLSRYAAVNTFGYT